MTPVCSESQVRFTPLVRATETYVSLVAYRFRRTLRDAEDFVEAPLIDRAAKGILEDVIVRSGVQLDHLLQDFDVSSCESYHAGRGGGLWGRFAFQRTRSLDEQRASCQIERPEAERHGFRGAQACIEERQEKRVIGKVNSLAVRAEMSA